ncbi:hypothetical protein D3C72_1844500 [compost metagenome]
MAARSALIGSMPWALILASSMPVAQKSPTIFSMPLGFLTAATCSASWCCTATERSSRMVKAPQLVRSAGMALAASHLLLT